MIIKAGNITINVRNMDASVSFYTAIGLTLSQRWGDHYAQLTAPGIVIGLHPAQDDLLHGHSGNVSIGFTTDSMVDTLAALTAMGIEVHQRTEEGGTFLHFRDPDGTALYFIQPNW